MKIKRLVALGFMISLLIIVMVQVQAESFSEKMIGGASYKTQYNPSITTKDLGTLGGNNSCATGINDKGQIVGYSDTLNNKTHAFTWENGKITDLGTLLGGSYSHANGINGKGQIVGDSDISDGRVHAFIWGNGKMTDLGTFGGSYSCATGINDKGQVVGYFGRSDNKTHAFIWENGKMTDLGTLGGDYSCATGINDKGQIIGYSSVSFAGSTHAFIWENGKMTDLCGVTSNANGINDKGQVVGYFYTSNGKAHAFIWESGKITDLGALSESYDSTAFGINDKGQVVGGCRAPDNSSRAFIWKDGEMTDFGTWDGKYSYYEAYGINDKGQVVSIAADNYIPNFSHALMYEDNIDTLPLSISISPSDNSILYNKPIITVKVSGNVAVSSIKLQYSLDGTNWTEIGNKNTKGTAEFIWDTTALKGKVKVRAIVVDASGNKSINSPIHTYTIGIYGDLNEDRDADVFDLVMLKSVILRKKTESIFKYKDAADLNGDGFIDAIDYLLLKKEVQSR